MEQKSWACTLITQLSLCIAAFIGLNIGQPQNHFHGENLSNSRKMDTYFISVAGGVRPLEEQTLLLKKMVNVAKIYEARFVVDITEFGGSDPLLQNATLYPQLQNMPWYATGAMFGQGETYFLKKIELPYGQTLDVIVLDTMQFQDPPSVRGNDQIQWLERTLNESDGDWQIVVGFHQLLSCDHNTQNLEAKENPFDPLRNTLLHYGVDAYLSRQFCAGGTMGLTDTTAMDKGRYLGSMNQDFDSMREIRHGFILHRVSSLEMVTFKFKLTGEIEQRTALQQRGKAAMSVTLSTMKILTGQLVRKRKIGSGTRTR